MSLPPLHLLTDDAVCARPDFAAQAERLMRVGGSELLLHLRAPHAGGLALYRLAERLAAAGALVVNDRVDVALAAGAAGAQLGERSLSSDDVRGIAPAGFRIGLSVHDAEAALPRADWLIAGNVFETESHPGRPGAGGALIEQLSGRGIPVVAVGGVTPRRVASVRSAGAAAVAVIRGVWDAPDPERAVAAYLEAWHN